MAGRPPNNSDILARRDKPPDRAEPKREGGDTAFIRPVSPGLVRPAVFVLLADKQAEASSQARTARHSGCRRRSRWTRREPHPFESETPAPERRQNGDNLPAHRQGADALADPEHDLDADDGAPLLSA